MRGQEAAPALPRAPDGGPGAPDSEEEPDEAAAEEYDARADGDDLDTPRDYDDYTDNAHLSHHHD